MKDETDEVVEEVEEEVAERRPKKKPIALAKSKAKSPRSSKPAARMRIVWVVLNDAFKTVATFEFSQKEAADARAAELTAKGKGIHFVQRIKEPMPEDAPGIGAAIPRVVTPPAKAAREEEEIEELAIQQVQRSESRPPGFLHLALSATLWIVSFVVGFCVIPYHDVFSGYRYEPPDLFKPLIYGGIAMMAIRYGLGVLFGEKWDSA
jgi:hypothetical protein